MPSPTRKIDASVIAAGVRGRAETKERDPNAGKYDQIGARNPYALASFISLVLKKDPNPWGDDPHANRDTMVNLLKSGFKQQFDTMQYSDLFSKKAKIKSPLFMSHRQLIANLNSDMKETIAKSIIASMVPKVITGSASSADMTRGMVPRDMLKATRTGDLVKRKTPGDRVGAPPSDAVADTFGFAFDALGNQVRYYMGTKNESNILNDVNQGASWDCWVLAALYALAWTKPTSYPANAGAEPPALSAVTNLVFRNNKTGVNYPVTSVSTEFLTTSPNCLTCNRIDPNNPKMWAAAYEKAYAAVYQYPDGSKVPQSSLSYSGVYPNYPRPDVTKFGKGNPIEALGEISRKVPGFQQTYNSVTKTFYKTEVWDAIKLRCAASGRDANLSYKTTKPMVTYTYDDQVEQAVVADLGISYQEETIVSAHSYSILGKYQADGEVDPTKPPNDSSYIVLRNPWGLLPGANIIGGLKQDPQLLANADPLLQQAGAFATGIWKPCANVDRDLDINAQQDGIFALRFDPHFIKFFKMVGWVTL